MNNFSNISDPDKTGWPPEKFGKFIHIGHYPCDVALFKKFLPDLKEIFTVRQFYQEEARQRLESLEVGVRTYMIPGVGVGVGVGGRGVGGALLIS